MNIFKSISQWFRRLLNRGKESLAAELKRRLPQIEGALETAAIQWAGQTGGEPLAFFVGVAIQHLHLSAAATKFAQGLIGRLGSGSSRAVAGGTEASRIVVAKRDLSPMLAAIREEAAKA